MADVTNDPQIDKRQGAYLPHWTRDGAIYFVTFRTADSLPREAVERLRAEARLLERKTQWQHVEPEELLRLSKLKSESYLRLLDDCHGECVLRRDDCASMVAGALQHFAEQRYRLWAWCVMPNHVHVVVQPHGTHGLPDILKAWKSYSSRKIGAVLSTKGVFWQAEYFDRLIRNEAEIDYYVRYTLDNPAAAGLRNWKWAGVFASA